MVDALTGWLGLVIMVVAALAALGADLLRQRPAGDAPAARGWRSWVVRLGLLASVLALAGGAATVLRFVVLT